MDRSRRRIATRRAHALVVSCVFVCAGAAQAAKEAPSISDDRVLRAIESELFEARGVSPNAIDLEVEEGVATLSGDVAHLLARKRAVRIARQTKGVRSVVNRLAVRDSGRADGKIQQDVVRALAADPATESWEIGVSVDEGAVTLTGSVESFAEKQLAATVAQGVRGVRELHNRIQVNWPPPERSDAEIVEEVRDRLAWDTRVDAALVDVSVDDGRVALSGWVGSAHERSLVRGLAWVSGVEEVDDSALAVRWWARDEMQRQKAWPDVTDEEIRDAVKDAFLYDPRVFSFAPEVAVESGVVTLRGVVDGTVHLYGSVDSYFEKEQAVDVASRVRGAKDVVDRLTVEYPAPLYGFRPFYDWDPVLYDYDFDTQTIRFRDDWEIRDDVESELWWSPFVDADEVEVSVEDGVATLTGTVDSWVERNAAAENAIEAGAIKVVNRLEVGYGPEALRP